MPDSNESDGSYDPLLGRFLSPDDVLPDPTNLQAYNRYSYVINNPLAYTDPTGNEYDGPGTDGRNDDGSNNGTNPNSGDDGATGPESCRNCDNPMPSTIDPITRTITINICGCLDDDPTNEVTESAIEGVIGSGDSSSTGSNGITAGGANGGGGSDGATGSSGNSSGNGNGGGGIATGDPGGGTGGGNVDPGQNDGITTDDVINAINVVSIFAPLPQVKVAAVVIKAGLRYGPKAVQQLARWGRGLGRGKKSAGPKNADTLQPGPFASESIAARGPGRNFSKSERTAINNIGRRDGCHTCGSKDPGTKSGNFIPDHQKPNALNKFNRPQQLFPHCKSCSARQAGQVTQAKRRGI